MVIDGISIEVRSPLDSPSYARVIAVTCRHGNGARVEFWPSPADLDRLARLGVPPPPLTRRVLLEAWLKTFGEGVGHHPSCDCWAALALRYGPPHVSEEWRCGYHGIGRN